MRGKAELEHIYGDWMGENIPQSHATYEMMDFLETKYSGLVQTRLFQGVDANSSDDEKDYLYLCAKITACHQKLNMMQFARKNAIESRREFETTQNMCVPSLFGLDRTRILFYTESAILFARNALDIAATFFSKLLLDGRMDSFNDLSKKLINAQTEKFAAFQHYFNSVGENPIHAYRLLCGVTKGRALRDIIVHQTNINIEYFEYRENSEKEKLFVIVKDAPISEFDEFLTNLCDGVEEILQFMIDETRKLTIK